MNDENAHHELRAANPGSERRIRLQRTIHGSNILTYFAIVAMLLGTLFSGRSMNAQAIQDDGLFYVYRDGKYKRNHFVPSGYMGDQGDISIDELWAKEVWSGDSCIRVVYTAEGKPPKDPNCDYPGPCKWAGVYWLNPANNWGVKPIHKGEGFSLVGYTRLEFWAKSSKPTKIEFKVGGIREPFGDSLARPSVVIADLDTKWQKFEIDLVDANLSHIIGGFCWVTNWDENPNGAEFYLDDIRFAK